MDKNLLKNNDGLTSRQTHHPTKNLTIQIMENKERYHNATSIAPLVGLEPTTLGCWQPMLYQLSYQGKMGMGSGKSKSATTRHCPLNPLVKC